MTHEPPPPAGWIALTLQGNVMTSGLVPPRVRLNGYPMTAHYGLNVFPVPPGRWHVDVHCTWMRRYGEAALDFHVAPGQTVPVFYAAPFHQFRRGEIGHERQRRRGLGGMIALLTIVFGIVTAVTVVAALA